MFKKNLQSQMCLAIRCAAALVLAMVCAATSESTAAELNTDQLLKTIGVSRGICVLVGEDVGRLAVDLARNSELTLYVQSPNANDVKRTRRLVDAAGLLGTRVYVEQGNIDHVHLADNLADAVIAVGLADGRLTDRLRVEMLRVLHPRGKVINEQGKVAVVKPVPEGEGDWSHPYHGPDNNPQGNDKIARAPYLTRFLANPYYGPMPEVTVSSGGRLFKAFGHVAYKRREWAMLSKLIALNGYNGAKLWQRDLTPGFMIHRNTIVATPKTLFLADNDSCKLIDAATGKITDEIVVPKGISDGPGWKWIALNDGVLYALVGEKDLVDEVLRGTRDKPGWPWSGMGKAYAHKEYPWGFGRTLLAIDPATKKILWHHKEEDKIDSRALAMHSGRIFIYSDRKFLKAIDAKTGELVWKSTAPDLLAAIGEHKKAQNPREGYSSTVYTKANEQVLLFAGPQRSKLVAVSAYDGRLLWQHDHGNYQLVLRDDAVYALGRTETSKKFDYVSGKVLADLECFRGNCTRATGTVDSIFTRGYRHTGTMRFDLAKSHAGRLPAMRPACQDGVVVANGLLYWGPWMCDCNHSLVGVISLGPAGRFDFEQQATNADRLQVSAEQFGNVAELSVSDADWPTYRRNNQRTASTKVAVAETAKLVWQAIPAAKIEPTAPVTAGGLTFVSGSDGIVRCFDSSNGKSRWTAYTGGPVKYPPTVWKGRLYVGSGDGYVYAFEAATGRQLWRFRAAPIERKIPVYGTLSSCWPVASGVLVEDGVAYAAAGIVSHDGTHVYALDAVTGKIKWQNNTSGNLAGKGANTGVSVQGHMLLHENKLYMAGGNVVSPAIYETQTGKCLNTLKDEWQRSPRGSELFLAAGQVRVVDKTMYSPRDYIPSRYHAKYLLQATDGDVVIQGTERAMQRVALNADSDGKPKLVWKDNRFIETSAVVLAANAVLVAGRLRAETGTDDAEPNSVLIALNPQDGKTIWSKPLPARAASWGLAVDRDGRIVVTLVDGRVLCFAG